jgi:hypothetical protein
MKGGVEDLYRLENSNSPDHTTNVYLMALLRKNVIKGKFDFSFIG